MADWTTRMRDVSREIAIGGSITLPSGTVRGLTGADIACLTISEGADGALMIGDVLCAQCTIDLTDIAAWRSAALIGGTASLTISAAEGADLLTRPLGTFIITGATELPSEAKLRLTLSDSIASELCGTFSDSLTYPATLAQLWAHAISQTRYVWSGTVPNGSAVIASAPEWSEAISLRSAIGMIAAAAGCFVRIGRGGDLELCRAWDSARSVHAIAAQAYLRMEADSASFGPVDALIAGDTTYYATSAHTAVHCVTVQNNPLFANAALAQGAAELIGGYCARKLELAWRGDPEVKIGDRVRITDGAGNTYDVIVSGQTMQYQSGFSATITCAVPASDDAGVRRAITPEGGVNAEALVGAVNGALISAYSVTAQKLAAGSVTAEKLAAGAIDAAAVTALAAKIETLTAASITTDRLAAAMAAFEVIAAGTATFDAATVRHLVSAALNVTNSTSGDAFIENLRVKYAQIVSATIGDLCIKASDGNYYLIDVNANGTVTATQTTVTAEEIAQGHTTAGDVIVATDITAANLSTANIFATYALVNQIDAARIDVDQLYARQAFIDKLNTTDISSNSSIQVAVHGVTDQMIYLDAGGVHVRNSGSGNEVLITNEDVRIMKGANEYGKFAAGHVQFGSYQLRETSDGGMAFVFV